MALYTARGIVAITSSLPAGVTLQAIDGESLTSATTMSKNYFARNGYTAATNTGYNGTSWDDANFFPVTVYFGLFPADLTLFQGLGSGVICGPGIAGGDATVPTLTSNLIWGIPGGMGTSSGQWQVTSTGTTLNVNTNLNAGIAGISLGDLVYASDGTNSLPQGTTITAFGSGSGQTGTYTISNAATPGNLSSCVMNDAGGAPESTVGAYCPALHSDEGNPTAVIGAVPHSQLQGGGRFLNLVSTWQALNGGAYFSNTFKQLLSQSFYTDPSGTAVSLGTFEIDLYWFAEQADTGLQAQYAGMLGIGSMTQAQMALGSNYGNMIDTYRSWGNGSNNATVRDTPGTSGAVARLPFFGVIENRTGLTGLGTITPVEMNWAIWSSIIHGARGIKYFVYTDNSGAGFTNPGTGGGTWAQAVATNAQIASFASVLNAPSALGFCSVSPHGYIFPVPESNWLNGGVELIVKWFGGKFYIFATTRNAEAAGSTAATFTISTGVGNTATILDGRGGTKTISGGVFTDTFLHSYDVYIYRIDP